MAPLLQARGARPSFDSLIAISKRETTRRLLFFEHFLASPKTGAKKEAGKLPARLKV